MRHYKQTTDYTCDPACLMMAMNSLSGIRMTKGLEMQIWKEANLRAVEGCLPQGLALSAIKRKFETKIICKKKHMYETTKKDKISVDIAKKQEAECTARGVKITDKTPTITDIKKSLKEKSVPLILVSAEKVHGIKSPHWIVVSKVRGTRIYFHDTLLNKEMSLTKEEFKIMHNQIKSFLNKRALIISKQERLP